MKKFSRYFLLLIVAAAGAGVALSYLMPGGEVVVENNESPADDFRLRSRGLPGMTDEEKSGYALEFEGKKLSARIGRVKLKFNRAGGNYDIDATIRMAGIFKNIMDEKLLMKSRGAIVGSKTNTEYFYNATERPGKKPREKTNERAPVWKFNYRGTEKDVDAKIYEAATDPLSLLVEVGFVLGAEGHCNFKRNVFMEDTGFVVESFDRGDRKDSGVKSGKKDIAARRCDIMVGNRAGKVQKDFPFDHEFAKKGARVRKNKIHVYYAKMGVDEYVPVYIRIIETPVGDIDIRLNKITRF